MEEAKVSIFLYYRYRFTTENTVDIGGAGMRGPRYTTMQLL